MGAFDDLAGTAGGDTVYGKAGGESSKPPRKSSGSRKGIKHSPEARERRAARHLLERIERQQGGEIMEAVGGEVVQTSGGVASSAMPSSVEDVARMATAWVGEWCEVHGVQDTRKLQPQEWRACCRHIGQTYVKPSRILRDTKPHGLTPTGGASTCGAYDAGRVAAMLDVFWSICDQAGQVPFDSSFACFCGVSLTYVREYVEGVTSAGFDVAQRTHAAELDAVRMRASGDQVGRIAILNNELWGGVQSPHVESAQAAAALPRFGDT